MIRAVLLTGGNQYNINKDIVAVKGYISLHIGRIVCESTVEMSKAWGFESSDLFYNQILVVETELIPDELLFKIWHIEKIFGRERLSREQEKERWLNRKSGDPKNYSSRSMDIDILYYGDEIVETEFLTIPHPEIENREFVKVLLRQIENVINI